MPSTPVQTLNAIRAERIVVTQPVTFFLLNNFSTDLCPAGSVAIVAGLSNSDLYRKVTAGLTASDTAAVDAALKTAASSEGAAPAVASDEQAVAKLAEQPAFADIRFLNRTLVSNVFVTPEVDFVRYLLPFAGGRLEPQDFEAAYFLKSEDAARFQVAVVVNAPAISADDAAVLNNLPASSREMLIPEGPVGLLTTTIIVTIGVAGVAAGIAYGVGRATQHWRSDSATEAERSAVTAAASLQNLSPTAAVQKLLAAKRDALAALSKS